MKLKAHREDVTTLKSWVGDRPYTPIDLQMKEIAARYERLIKLAEEADKLYYQGIYTDKAKRVLEDAKGEK